MNRSRLGTSFRALRRRRGWTQSMLALRVGVSRSVVSRLERGEGGRLQLDRLERLADALGASIDLQVRWHGEALDRLLDQAHARLIEVIIELLNRIGWITAAEVTFHFGPDRGSIDVLATHQATGHLLVIEVKSVVPDLQAMLSGLDRKARVAPSVAHGRGWPRGPVSRLLVLPSNRTVRRRLAPFESTISSALPARTVEVRRWLRSPDGPLAGVLFVPDARPATARHRVPGPRRPVTLRDIPRR